MKRAPGSRRTVAWWIAALALGGMAAYGFFVWRPPTDAPPARAIPSSGPVEPPVTPAELAPLPLSEVPFKNAAPGVAFVGAEACRTCHAEQHASYLATPHSRALAPLAASPRPRGAPAEAEFRHPRTGRDYEVAGSGSEARHRETLHDAAGNALLAAEWPLAWAIGSGNHTQSYLLQADEWLVESPITWYASTGRWDLSPGYDHVRNDSFERIADLGCLVCHAGRVEPKDGSRYRVTIHEQAISCESCHGPGALHVAHQQAAAASAGSRLPANTAETDDTIVHPGRLDRAASEALCAQCHLRGAATVPARGRAPTEFRPGRRLEEFRVDYVLRRQSETMNVVGHVEQMRLSACYQKSDSLTCISCHDPHGSPAAAERVAFYRAKCLECHDDCQVPEVDRRHEQPEDDCTACHMPRQPTDLQHVAFVHHRIGLPRANQDEAPPAEQRFIPTDELVPLVEPADWPLAERQRSLGLAWLEFAEKNATPDSRDLLFSRSWLLLEAAYTARVRDASSVAALARLSWERGDLRRAEALAGEALRLSDPGSGSHTSARLVLAAVARERGNAAASAAELERVVADRRQSQDWLLLGECRFSSGDVAGAVTALKTAAEIHPFRPDIHEALAAAYLELRDSPQAAHHRKLAAELRSAVVPSAEAK